MHVALSLQEIQDVPQDDLREEGFQESSPVDLKRIKDSNVKKTIVDSYITGVTTGVDVGVCCDDGFAADLQDHSI